MQQQSSITNHQGNNEYFSNSEIAEAEMRKSELIAVKENLDRNMASSYQLRAQLQKQLQNMFLTVPNQEIRRKPSQLLGTWESNN